MTAVGVFLLFGALMAFLAGTTLIWPGTALDRLWALNAPAYKQLAPFGTAVGAFFLLLGTILTAAGVGWLRHRIWGFRLAVVIIGVQVLGNLVNAFRGDIVRGGVGSAIAVALLIYLLHPKVRAVFADTRASRLPSPR
jgi:hypothetical protein